MLSAVVAFLACASGLAAIRAYGVRTGAHLFLQVVVVCSRRLLAGVDLPLELGRHRSHGRKAVGRLRVGACILLFIIVSKTRMF